MSTIRNLDPLYEALIAAGLLPSQRGRLRNALLIATSHDSYLYEHQQEMSDVSPGILTALGNTGNAFLRRAAATRNYSRYDFDKPGPLSDRIALVLSSVGRWAKKLPWLIETSALGKSLNAHQLPDRVTANIFQQLVGVLCLTQNEKVASQLIESLLEEGENKPASLVADPWQIIGKELNGELDCSFVREGPDHLPRFVATVSDQRGRRSTGTGQNKRTARTNAAKAFLDQHLPFAIPQEAARTPSHPRVFPASVSNEHFRTVGVIQNLFSISPGQLGLVAQSLIHSSWAYENQDLLSDYRQNDNQVLGLVGATVLMFEHTIAVCARAIKERKRELAFQPLTNEIYESTFYRTGIAKGVLLGEGQKRHGFTREMAANAFQAVIAAVFLDLADATSLTDCWPTEWATLYHSIFTDVPREQDDTTKLQILCSITKLEVLYAWNVRGPQHDNQHRCTITLQSLILNEDFIVAGDYVAGKTYAKHKTSRIILNTIDDLSNPDSLSNYLDENHPQATLARFLLKHLALNIPSLPTGMIKWRDYKLFGASLSTTPVELLKWAEQVDHILANGSVSDLETERVEHFFRSISTANLQGVDTVLPYLSKVLDWIDGIQEPGEISNERIVSLADLCGVYRALGSDEPDIELASLREDWHLLYNEQVNFATKLPSIIVPGRDRAALDALLGEMVSGTSTATVATSIEESIHLHISSDAPVMRHRMEILCNLWNSVSGTLFACVNKEETNITLTGITAADLDTPITKAAAEATRPLPVPYSAAVADLLHDLKNQLVAARHALATPTQGRTAQLEQQLTASRHLDRAIAISRRLRTASSLVSMPGSGTTRLGPALRDYVAFMLRRLPATISLSVPVADDSVLVALDQSSLTAVLDNLVQNSIEAMPDGGSIRLDWTTDGAEALLEIADSGPGLPDNVATALRNGTRVTSTKSRGNGVGLVGVKTLLQRAGGEIDHVRSQKGTVWLLTIPLAEEGDQ
ncbi:ATP-binding protein [Actinomadura geliboluensis]